MLRLPDLLLFSNFDSNWDSYINAVYEVFSQDLKDNPCMFQGRKINIKKHPMFQGKEKAFWHLTTEGDVEDERLPDLRRCERIKWIRYILDNINNPEIRIWRNIRRNKINICISVENFEYLIVLGERTNYLVLLSAYPVEYSWRRRKLKKEYEDYKKQNPLS